MFLTVAGGNFVFGSYVIVSKKKKKKSEDLVTTLVFREISVTESHVQLPKFYPKMLKMLSTSVNSKFLCRA